MKIVVVMKIKVEFDAKDRSDAIRQAKRHYGNAVKILDVNEYE